MTYFISAELAPVKKYRNPDVSSFACSKSPSRCTILVGSSNGIITEFNMKDNSENILLKQQGNSVNFMEYSKCGEYFCSLHENGKSNFFKSFNFFQ